MSRRNTEGQQLRCNHCGWEWFYQGNNQITSCPKCGWRVRVFVPSAGSSKRPVDSFQKTDQLF